MEKKQCKALTILSIAAWTKLGLLTHASVTKNICTVTQNEIHQNDVALTSIKTKLLLFQNGSCKFCSLLNMVKDPRAGTLAHQFC